MTIKKLNDTLENDSKKKNSKVKKNINIFKKDKTIKIKLKSKEPKKKSMEESLKSNEVLLWGINRIDSILLNKYENNKNLDKIDNTKVEIIEKTQDTEYNPLNTYNICDLDFLNLEFDRIENKISQMKDLTDEYDNLLDLQDSLTELINELVEKSKNNKIQVQKQITNIINNNDNKKILLEVEIDKTKTVKTAKTVKNKIKKLKPYYLIGEIPEGYREATEEEAIINKKVSFYGKKRANRELNSLFEITGTIFLDIIDKVELNKQIISLKGKLNYYKKEIEYYKISLNSDAINSEKYTEIKDKINENKNYYKKTLDIYNLYVKQYNTQNNIVNKT